MADAPVPVPLDPFEAETLFRAGETLCFVSLPADRFVKTQWHGHEAMAVEIPFDDPETYFTAHPVALWDPDFVNPPRPTLPEDQTPTTIRAEIFTGGHIQNTPEPRVPVTVGDVVSLHAVLYDQFGAEMVPIEGITWESNNGAYLTAEQLDLDDCAATMLLAGNVSCLCRYANLSGQINFAIAAAPIVPAPPASISVKLRDSDGVVQEGPNITYRCYDGDGTTALATLLDADGNALLPTEFLTWTSNNTGDAQATVQGPLSAWIAGNDPNQGSASITIASPSVPGVTASIFVDIVPRPAPPIPPEEPAMAIIGDFKHGFQVDDHDGWIALDGRAITTLTAAQQTHAATFGWTANLPDSMNAIAMKSTDALGSLAGAMLKTLTIAQANLPAVDLAASEAAATPATTSDAGEHFHEMQACTNDEGTVGFSELLTDYPQKVWRRPATIANTNNGNLLMSGMAMDPTGIHSHTVTLPAHGHIVPLGGSGTPIDIDVTPATIAVNDFVFLGTA